MPLKPRSTTATSNPASSDPFAKYQSAGAFNQWLATNRTTNAPAAPDPSPASSSSSRAAAPVDRGVPVSNPTYTRVVGDPRTDPNAAAQRAKLEDEVNRASQAAQGRINSEVRQRTLDTQADENHRLGTHRAELEMEQMRTRMQNESADRASEFMSSGWRSSAGAGGYSGGGGGRGGGGGGGADDDGAMRQIQLDTARERLNMMRSPSSVDPGALASLRSAAMPAAVPPPSYVVDKGASDAAFGRAKDKAGLLALRRTADARTNAQQRGITGSGIDAQAMDSILGDSVDNLTGVATAQAENEAGRQYDVSNMGYQGAIQQRGQELSLTPTLLSLLDRKRFY